MSDLQNSDFSEQRRPESGLVANIETSRLTIQVLSRAPLRNSFGNLCFPEKRSVFMAFYFSVADLAAANFSQLPLDIRAPKALI
jgi:hypothetical protein